MHEGMSSCRPVLTMIKKPIRCSNRTIVVLSAIDIVLLQLLVKILCELLEG